jgi:uncharacterized membrane protein YfcA
MIQTLEFTPLIVLLFVMATLYSSVGHGGASGYLAAMALFGLSPEVMKPTVLCMNIVVSGYVSIRFWQSQRLNWYIIFPFIVFSIPMAFVGGGMQIQAVWYKFFIGVVLVISAIWLLYTPVSRFVMKCPTTLASTSTGAALGFVSGLTGVGGGIFLSPILLFFRWADARSSAGTVAIFILVNSIAGLTGFINSGKAWGFPLPIYLLIMTIIVGAVLGEKMNSKGSNAVVVKLLAFVLLIASAKMFYYVFS